MENLPSEAIEALVAIPGRLAALETTTGRLAEKVDKLGGQLVDLDRARERNEKGCLRTHGEVNRRLDKVEGLAARNNDNVSEVRSKYGSRIEVIEKQITHWTGGKAVLMWLVPSTGAAVALLKAFGAF